jgi:hypothetical protein
MMTALSRAMPPLLQPFADDRLGIAALVAGNPGGIDVGGIDRIEARIEEGVENPEGGLLVGGPAEDIAAENDRRDRKAGFSKTFAFP